MSFQIVSKLRSDIITGKYAPGEQFPTVRQLAYDASVNPNTMQKSLLQLETEVLLISKGTVGRFITSDINIIQSIKSSVYRAYMSDILKQAYDMGITKEDLINFIRESED